MKYMKNDKTKRLVTLSLFGALIIVLQIIATYINIGGFPITLTLVPMIIAGAIFGIKEGIIMGLIFGVIVDIMCITGGDPSGAALLNIHPIVILTACLLKGALAGFASAFAYHKIENKKVAIFVGAGLAPIVNTCTLYIALIIFFDLSVAAMFGALMSVNFIIELLINMLLAPGLLRIINARRK